MMVTIYGQMPTNEYQFIMMVSTIYGYLSIMIVSAMRSFHLKYLNWTLNYSSPIFYLTIDGEQMPLYKFPACKCKDTCQFQDGCRCC